MLRRLWDPWFGCLIKKPRLDPNSSAPGKGRPQKGPLFSQAATAVSGCQFEVRDGRTEAAEEVKRGRT